MYLIHLNHVYCESLKSNTSTLLMQTFILISLCTLISDGRKTKGNEPELHEILSASYPGYKMHKREKVPNSDIKLVCFYTFTKQFSPRIMEGLCTHINVGFFRINAENNTLEVSSEQEELLPMVASLKEKEKGLKIIISVGGAGVAGFNTMVVNHVRRKAFIRSCMQVLRKYKLDGIDLDWEWPVVVDGHFKEKVKFIQLLYEIKQEFNRHEKQYILSADVAAAENVIELSYYVNYIAEYVDYVNVMCYDYHFFTKLFPFTGHNAPLYAPGDNFFSKNINQSIYFWISKSMPREKIILGIPTYGHSYELIFSNKNSLNAPSKGFGSIGKNGFADYPEICKFLQQKNVTVVYDKSSKVPYAYRFPDWISYDDEVSLAAKANYVLKEKLGGAMVFSVNADDVSGSCKGDGVPLPLITSVRNILLNKA